MCGVSLSKSTEEGKVVLTNTPSKTKMGILDLNNPISEI